MNTKTKTVTTYSINHTKPLPHATLVLDVVDDKGNEFTHRHNELSSDWAVSNFSNDVRRYLDDGYTLIVGEDVNE